MRSESLRYRIQAQGGILGIFMGITEASHAVRD